MYRILTKPKPPNKTDLTPRDIAIIRATHRYRFTTTDQLQKLTGSKDRRSLNSRLRILWAAGFLDRPAIQREIFAYRDKRPTIHALGQQGAKWLAINDGVRFPIGKGWASANKIKSSIYLEHRLGVTDTMLTFTESLTGLDGCRLIEKDEVVLTSPTKTHKLKFPFRMATEVHLPSGEKVRKSTVPDYTFAIGDQRQGSEKRALFFLEWDNSTEDYIKTDPRQSMILGKYLAYADAYNRKIHTKQFGFKNFRVLFVVNGSDDRVMKMIKVYQTYVAKTCPAGSFLHTTMDELVIHGVLAKIWQTGKGEYVSLIPNASSNRMPT